MRFKILTQERTKLQIQFSLVSKSLQAQLLWQLRQDQGTLFVLCECRVSNSWDVGMSLSSLRTFWCDGGKKMIYQHDLKWSEGQVILQDAVSSRMANSPPCRIQGLNSLCTVGLLYLHPAQENHAWPNLPHPVHFKMTSKCRKRTGLFFPHLH